MILKSAAFFSFGLICGGAQGRETGRKGGWRCTGGGRKGGGRKGGGKRDSQGDGKREKRGKLRNIAHYFAIETMQRGKEIQQMQSRD